MSQKEKTHFPYSLEIVDYNDDYLSAMMRMTAFPASIVLQAITSGGGDALQDGVLEQENCIDPAFMIRELKARGIVIKEEIGPWF